ncbi:hypothetical protein B0J13DRAFT_629329 [Dactylonectria estremocensis]|uniref:Uncharacterized protein n=1 Tax=Dactylonectria estremocensis TaxID=1079267 RepID=A0A9P9DJD5_9HYPO|nr:hypothetical protein B0J13DRAFT_629329 [Dactylonectria estremocensis]
MASVPDAPIPIGLGPRTPLHLPQVARAALIQGSEYDISEGMIPETFLFNPALNPALSPALSPVHSPALTAPQRRCLRTQQGLGAATAINLSAAAAGVVVESQAILDDKMKVFRTFCAAFDETAKQFPTGRMFRFAQEMLRGFLSHWASALNGDSQPPAASHPVRSYASALAADLSRRLAAPLGDEFQTARGTAPDPQRQPPGPRQARRPQEQQQQENSAVAYDDPGVFVRLHEKSPAWEKHPFAIRTHLADKLGIKLDAIPQASRTKTGWAIRPANLDIPQWGHQRRSPLGSGPRR